ncbi:DNA polymerase III subunit beta [Alphaproteobacteria bacterium]|nr:DNA polymerase III subunit beta [Alphaproteobacteria bacterium]
MKIIVTQENLSKALNIVSRVASTRTTLPVLNNILIRTDNNQLLLTATNLEIFIITSINTKITKDGVAAVPANLVTEFVSNLPKTNINLDINDNKLKISAGNYNSTINTISPDDFPDLPDSKPNVEFEIDSKLFKEAAAQTVLAASNDTTRPILTGVYFHTFEGILYMTATDGYRLAERKLIAEKATIDSIIPTTTINEVVRVIDEVTEKIKISLSDDQIIFEIGTIKIVSRLIDGNFINYRQLIPSKTENSAILDKAEFMQTVKVAELFARESAESIILKTDVAKQVISVSSIASEFGENSSEIEGEIKGDASITLNAKYLLAALGAVEGDKVKFNFSGKLAPSLVTGENDNYKHIIMPVKS